MSSPLTSIGDLTRGGRLQEMAGVSHSELAHTSGGQLSVQSEVWRYAQSPESILDDRMVDYDRVPR